MNNIVRILLITVVILFSGTAIFLSTWDIPAPLSTVERVINNDRFSK